VPLAVSFLSPKAMIAPPPVLSVMYVCIMFVAMSNSSIPPLLSSILARDIPGKVSLWLDPTTDFDLDFERLQVCLSVTTERRYLSILSLVTRPLKEVDVCTSAR
jgi:hypothetical protein